MSDATEAAPGLLLSDDLIFTSRISGAARALGREVRHVRDLAQLPDAAGRLKARCVIVDLAFPGLDLPALIRQLGEACVPPPRVVGYGSHVDAAALHAARDAGCRPALPRSKFVEDLPVELTAWLAG